MPSFRLWLRELVRAAIVIVLASLLGWTAGFFYQTLFVMAWMTVLYWAYHLWKLQRWLDSPDREPPESWGLWGRVFDQIYSVQRRNLEARSQLASALDYLQDSLASMRDGAIIVDAHGDIAWANTSASDLLSIEFPRDRGQQLLSLVRSPAFHQYFMEVDHSAPLREMTAEGEERCLQYEVSVFGGGDRLIFVRDISDTHRLELMRRDFVGNVSHELRTPLTVMRGYLDTLQELDALQSEQIQKPLRQMNAQTDRMEVLLKDLLLLSKIESFESRPKTDRVMLQPIIEVVLDDLRQAYPNSQIDVIFDDVGSVLGDAGELKSAIVNLVENALKYGEGKPIEVRLSRADGRLIFSVTDSGPGIPANQVARLTERFYRTDASRSQRIPGTGLGLAIVKHVATAHRADLDIRSMIGEGSTFSLSFSEPHD